MEKKPFIDMNKEYIIVSDDDGHNYVISSNKYIDWYEWLDSPKSLDGEYPSFAQEINGSISLVKFQNYRID